MTIPRTDARIRTLTVGIAVALAGILLYLSLRGIEWREVGRIVAGASPGRLALVLGIASVALLLRAVRWHVLLASSVLTIPAVFWATAAGYFGNNFLPARAGELVRTMMISARRNIVQTPITAVSISTRQSAERIVRATAVHSIPRRDQ